MAKANRFPLLIALAVAAAALVAGNAYLKNYEQRVSGGRRVALLFVLQDLAPGTNLSPKHFGVREVPERFVDTRHVRKHDARRVTGIAIKHELQAQQSLQWTDLALEPDERQVAKLLVPGKRAVPIAARSISMAGNGLLKPGDFVDVLATMRGKKQTGSVVLLQRVMVLAVGSKTVRHGNSGSGRDGHLMLSLDLHEAQLLNLAQSRGTLSIAVRHPDDQRLDEASPEITGNSLAEARASAAKHKKRGIQKVVGPQRLRAYP